MPKSETEGSSPSAATPREKKRGRKSPYLPLLVVGEPILGEKSTDEDKWAVGVSTEPQPTRPAPLGEEMEGGEVIKVLGSRARTTVC